MICPQQMGVSPWYWWADVPVPHQDAVFVKAGKYEQGPPAVKYRGIFLNDEAPDLTGWVKEKFGGLQPSRFYTNVFELLLRLKANYLWPAMWNNCFNEDDPLNPRAGRRIWHRHGHLPRRADDAGGQGMEPAGLRGPGLELPDATPNVLDSFWQDGLERNKNYENIITIGMRGED